MTIRHLINHAEELGLSSATSLLTIGPHIGVVEAGIIGVMPRLEVIYAIEPNRFNCLKLKEQRFPVKFDLQEKTLEDVQKFTEKVDIILLSHVASYLQGSFDKQLAKLMELLKSSGSLLLLQPEYDDVYSRVGLKFNDPVSAFTAADVRKALMKRGIEGVKEYGPAVYRIDVQNFDIQFASFLVHRKVTKEEYEAIFKFIDQETCGSGEILRYQIIFKITAKNGLIE